MALKVFIPTPLRSYTGRASRVEAEGSTLEEVFSHLDRGYPGLRFRIVDEQGAIREHIRVFVNQERAYHLRVPLSPGDQVQIICALSGG